uniref:Zinc finger A20 and AN1 domain-containing stress-associated protein 8 n=1 Tax=Nicotiana tabacum TaxID=4097 RepID=A0A1S3Y192_TOBAC|nr:PREDICTED: putative zinc finger A20 and AN1 domain-containing stress-associated protein 8 [Nicotiana tabacum]
MASCDKAENSSLCARGCGFYDNPSNYNICSQFYKAFLKKESAKSAIALSEKLYFLTVDDTVKTGNDDCLTMKTKTERCKCCKKKVGLVGFSSFLKEESAKSAIALSEKLYFLTVDNTVKTENDDGLTMKTKTERIHRYLEEHTCTFNFKSMGRALLVKENPLCKADKLEYRI